VSQDEHPTEDELRQLEAVADARFQTVSSRFGNAEDRFRTFDARLDAIEQQLRRLTRSTERRCNSIDARIDAARTLVDQLRSSILTQIDETRRSVGQVVLLCLLGTTVTTAVLCLCTIVLVT
jgi:uncharacterized protein involved in exopolysaccharide biosynthesis